MRTKAATNAAVRAALHKAEHSPRFGGLFTWAIRLRLWVAARQAAGRGYEMYVHGRTVGSQSVKVDPLPIALATARSPPRA